MHLNKHLSLFILLSMLFIILTGCTTAKQIVKKAPADAQFSSTPTLFLHGYGGDASSMQPMIDAISAAKLGTPVEVIHIRTNQTLAASGTLTAKLNNPLINIVFDDSTHSTPTQNAIALKTVIEKLYRQHHFDNFNIVAHSMGNSTLATYLLKYHNDQTLPTLNKYVAITSISNSFKGGNSGNTKAAESPLQSNGEPTIPSQTFHTFKTLHTIFPQSAQVLNIFGNLDDGSNSDGRVPINSAQSLKYLTTHAKSYQQLEFHGKSAQHSSLKRNSAVEKATMKFLFE